MRRSDQRRAAVFVSYQRDLTGHPLDDLLEAARRDRDLGATGFTRDLVEGAESERAELDRLIDENAEGWTLERIARLERCILRIALFEMLYRDDIPVEVAIDEAVETTKQYCGKDAPAFINGILGQVARNMDLEKT